MVERLLKALRDARPRTVRQLFALANQHIRWELNDMARRLDEQPVAVDLSDEQALRRFGQHPRHARAARLLAPLAESSAVGSYLITSERRRT